jgi:threonine synthase
VPHLAFQPGALAATPILPIDQVVTAFYLRLVVADKAGVLARITGILAEHDISIDACCSASRRRREPDRPHHPDPRHGRRAACRRRWRRCRPADGAGAHRAHPQGRAVVKYISTRGDRAPRGFSDILLEGLAPDGGLYLPTHYPRVDDATLTRWRGLPYADLAFEILSLYIDDIPAGDLKRLCQATYTEGDLRHEAIVPLRRLEDGVFLQALSNGPTLAFKDMAMQLLGNLFEYELARRGEQLNILGATSGDTGSAAEYAMRGKKGVRVFMLSPHGRMSPSSRRRCSACRTPTSTTSRSKACSTTARTSSRRSATTSTSSVATGSAPSTRSTGRGCWRRWSTTLPATSRPTQSNAQAVSFAVPTGNFGNICAGHVARCMGLPIDRLVLATNENDVLDEFFRTGTYRVRGSAETFETSSPSMDISKASNFERFVFDLLGRDGQRTAGLFGTQVTREGGFTLTPAEFAAVASFGFVAGKSTHADRLATIRDTWQRFDVMVDTHTADGLVVGRPHVRQGQPMLVLETAQPAKFAATIQEALGRDPVRPAALEGIEDLPRRFTVMPVDAARVKRYIETHCD